jgi:hypothetical protein
MQMIATSPKPQEPSMEEILASIRRIIADDQDGPKPAPPKAVKPEPSPTSAQPEQPEARHLGEAAPSEELPSTIQPAPSEEPASTIQPAPSASPEEQEDAAHSEADLDPVDFDAADLEEPVEPELPTAEGMNVYLEPDVVHQRDPEPVAEDHLLSRVTDQSVSHAFNMLTHTVLSHNARTLEDLVKDMLRPMLKSWLDENLPIIVERLVRAEIERVARGGR